MRTRFDRFDPFDDSNLRLGRTTCFLALKPMFKALGLISIICGLLLDCAPSRAQVVGTYARTYRGMSEQMSFNEDGTFKQAIRYPDGAAWSSRGAWKLVNRVVQLDKCYLTFDDEHQMILILQ
jgi:hypothetical protein